MIAFLLAILLVLVALVCWFLQLLGLPGNWLMVISAAGYVWLVPEDSPVAFGWPPVVALVVLAIVGEIVELVAGAAGVTKVGGSRRGAVLAIVGSIAGSLVGVFVGLPIPVVGSLVAAVLFGAVGALVGAFLGESWRGRDFDASLTVGKAAFIGRVLGTVGKMIVCTIMVALTTAAVCLAPLF